MFAVNKVNQLFTKKNSRVPFSIQSLTDFTKVSDVSNFVVYLIVPMVFEFILKQDLECYWNQCNCSRPR